MISPPVGCREELQEPSRVRVALKIYEVFLCDRRHPRTTGQPGGPPTGQGRPPAAALGQPVGGTHPCPVGTPSAPSDAYKIRNNLLTSGGQYFPEKAPRRIVISNPSSGVILKQIPALCRRGDRTRRALHRHAFLRDDL